MEKVSNSFEKGLSKDFSAGKQPVGTYPHAENIIRDVQATVKSERGTTLLAQLDTLTNVVIIGETVIGEEVIFFLTSTEGSSIIKLKADNTIQMILHTGNGYVPTVLAQSWQIGLKTSNIPTEFSILNAGSPTGTLTLTLDPDTSKVSMAVTMNNGAPAPMLINGTNFQAQATTIDVPESLMPKYGTAFIKNSHPGGDVDMGFWLSSTNVSSPTFYWVQSSGTNEFFITNPTEYDAIGVTVSSIAEDVLAFQSGYPIDAISRKNYKGEIIIYFTDFNNIPRRINTAGFIDATTFDSKTKLFLNPDLPRISGLEVTDGGGVTTGLYNFAARLGTITGNKTSFSQISNGIPVVNEAKAVGEFQYDGAEPQSPGGKAINISVNNINTNYQFIEIVAITYLGADNVLTANIVAKLPITNSSIVFEYYSENQIIEEILIEELAEEAIEYTQAKNILQKDNFLFLSNLKSATYSGYDTALQDVADDIQVFFTEKTGDVQSLTSLKYAALKTNDPEFGSQLVNIDLVYAAETTFKNYKNPEYTDKYKTYQRDEVYSFALVPIFLGGIHGNAYHIPGDSTNPTSQGDEGSEAASNRLRGWENSDGTIHHRMPSVNKSKPFQSRDLQIPLVPDELTYVPIGLIFKEINFPDELLAVLEGFTIVRQQRNKPNNGIVVAQGLAHNFYNGPNSTLLPIPGNGKCDVRYTAGGEDFDYEYYLQQDQWNNPYFAFYAPDIIHGVLDNTYFGNVDTLKQISIRNCDVVESNKIVTSTPLHKKYGESYCDVGDYSDNAATNKTALNVSQDLTKSFFYEVAPFQGDLPKALTLPDGKMLRTTGMNGKPVIFKLSSGKLQRDELTYKNDTELDILVLSGADIAVEEATNAIWGVRANCTTEINTIYAFPTNVYGDLSLAEYIKVEEFYFDENPGTQVTVYGGDTFLTRYDFNIGVALDAAEADVRLSMSTYLETKGNYAYRHYVPTEELGETTVSGTVPYAPKYRLLLSGDPEVVLGLWDYDLEKGPGEEYNKQYHFENTINKYYPVDPLFTAVTTYPNRITYSYQSFENEQFDAYRTFLTNNFHDVPKETGEITNMFEHNSILYAHTPHSLWRTFVNEKTFINSSTGDIVLGNGGLFPIPSKQLYTEEGGFAGSSAKWGSTNTPYGRIFIDNHQRKVFMLTGDELKEISDPHMFDYFTTLLDSSIPENYKIGYDPLNKRAILSIIPTTTIEVGTSLSYAFELQSWSSIHTYSVDRFATRDNKLLATSGGGIYEMATGDYNNYFGELYPSKLQFVMNAYPSTTKDYLNLKWIQRYKQTIFSEIIISTEDFTTGPIVPILVTSFAEEQKFLSLGAQHVHKVGGEYRMTIPPDNNPEIIYEDELFRPTIKGKYTIVELTYYPDLALNSPLELEHIGTEFIKIAE